MLWRGPMGGGAASGKIGAMIAGHCAQGQYLKSRVGVTNPRTTFQHPVRNTLRQLASQWGTLLTSTQRASWATYAENVTWVNRLGDTVHLSGQMEFIRSNWLRLWANLDPVLDGPTTFDRSSVGPAPTLSLSPGLTTGTLTMDVTAPWVDYSGQTALLLFVGIPRSGGIAFMKRRTRRCAVVRAAVMPLPDFLFTLPFTVPAFGQAWPAWVVATMADGRMTTPVPLAPVFTGPAPFIFADALDYPPGILTGQGGWTNDLTGLSNATDGTGAINNGGSPDGNLHDIPLAFEPNQPYTLEWDFEMQSFGLPGQAALGVGLGSLNQYGGYQQSGIQLFWDGSSTPFPDTDSVVIFNDAGGSTGGSTFSATAATIFHMELTNDGTNLTLTIDGTPYATIAQTGSTTNANSLWLTVYSQGPLVATPRVTNFLLTQPKP